MELNDFIIGKQYNLDGSIGVFLGVNLTFPEYANFKWLKNLDHWNKNIKITGNNLKRMIPIIPQPELSTEQKVALRCKRLWNNSNYVKQNPQWSY